MAVLGILALIAGMFGCKKTPKPADYELSDISEVSVSCCHMDYSFGYVFRLHLEDGKWLFDAECFTHDREVQTEFENREVSEEDAVRLLDIVKNNDLITYAANYKKPPASPFVVLDDTTYSFRLTFTDGSYYSTSDCQSEPEEYFYSLAEKYGDAETEAQ